MRQLGYCGLFPLLLLALPGAAAPANTNQYHRGQVEAGASWGRVEQLQAGDSASVVLVGSNGRAALGLYVFDEHGNCVARDDQGLKVVDDKAVEWVPAATGLYAVEVRNLGTVPNGFELAFRYRRDPKKETQP